MSNPYFPLKLSNWNFPQEIFKSVFLLLWSKVEIDIGIQWLDKGIMTQWSNQKGKSLSGSFGRCCPYFSEHIEIGNTFKILGPRPLWSEIIYICDRQKTLISLILTTSTPPCHTLLVGKLWISTFFWHRAIAIPQQLNNSSWTLCLITVQVEIFNNSAGANKTVSWSPKMRPNVPQVGCR